MRDLKAEFNLAGDMSISRLLSMSHIITTNHRIDSSEGLKTDVLEAVSRALDEVVAMRRREGENAAKEISAVFDKTMWAGQRNRAEEYFIVGRMQG